MFPIILTKEKLSAVIIGGGNAALIKVHTLLKLKAKVQVHCYSLDFIEEIKAKQEVHKRVVDFYELSVEELRDFDLIYITLSLSTTTVVVEELKRQGKLICVASKPELGNFINPCTRKNAAFMVSVSTYGKSPKAARTLSEKFIEYPLDASLAALLKSRGQ
ncbi:MAG: hypothetical protein HQK50_10135 [Oligoflexia bacterium]|nr:hypothetical protein [Oligoflexia bacterium]